MITVAARAKQLHQLVMHTDTGRDMRPCTQTKTVRNRLSTIQHTDTTQQGPTPNTCVDCSHNPKLASVHVLKALLLGHKLLPARDNARVPNEVRPAPLPRVERAQPELLVQHAMERRRELVHEVLVDREHHVVDDALESRRTLSSQNFDHT